MTYSESVQFLYALGNEMKTAKFGLERISALLEALGNPHLAYRVIHVAGTNGKGSVCAMIDAGLRGAGIRSGLYTSPHLVAPTERVQIDGFAISETEFTHAFEVVHHAALKLDFEAHPSYFETVTAMAFWQFRAQGVQTAVVETGLGGRLDATNVVNPALTVITPIDLDHQTWLGDTIQQIAAEKAGILKANVPAIISRQSSDAGQVVEDRAKTLGIRVAHTSNARVSDLEIDARGARFAVDGQQIRLPLPGAHQVENAVTAVLALAELGVPAAGIEETRWPGRLEYISPNPDVLLDGAHNPAGAQALAAYLRAHFPHRKIWMIFGAMRDKAVEQIASILFPLAAELIFTAPALDRAVPPSDLLALAKRGRTTQNIHNALQIAAREASDEDLILVTGSLYLIGEARAASYNRNSWPFTGRY